GGGGGRSAGADGRPVQPGRLGDGMEHRLRGQPVRSLRVRPGHPRLRAVGSRRLARRLATATSREVGGPARALPARLRVRLRLRAGVAQTSSRRARRHVPATPGVVVGTGEVATIPSPVSHAGPRAFGGTLGRHVRVSRRGRGGICRLLARSRATYGRADPAPQEAPGRRLVPGAGGRRRGRRYRSRRLRDTGRAGGPAPGHRRRAVLPGTGTRARATPGGVPGGLAPETRRPLLAGGRGRLAQRLVPALRLHARRYVAVPQGAGAKRPV
ncbi:MAG: hypothetical protein AVDCRST_MAG22-1166, partial [uncultured Rubrobacteraceae bacterium]